MEEFRKDPIMIFDYKTPEFTGIENVTATPNPMRRRSTAERVAAGSAVAASRTNPNRNAAGGAGRTVSRNTGSTGRPVSRNTGSAQTAAARKRREEAKKEEQRSRIATIAIVSCSVLAIVAIAIFLITLMGGGFFTPKQDNKVEVPQMVGSFYNKQQTYEGFYVKLADVGYHDEYKENEIYDQMPKAGEKVDPDEATIYIYVSLGPEPKVLTMENLVDLSVDAAKKYLIGQGVEDSRIIVREEYNENVAEGKVIWADGEKAYKAGDSFIIPAALGDYALEGGVLYKSYFPNVATSEKELTALMDKAAGMGSNLSLTVNFVEADVDGGAIIMQRAVPVEADDTPESLQQRVLAVEHQMLPECVKLLCEGKVQKAGRTVRVLDK